MRLWKNRLLKTILLATIVPLMLCLPLVGCSSGNKASQDKSPEEIEKSRQEHIKISEREASEA